jgi:hypothetical protein
LSTKTFILAPHGKLTVELEQHDVADLRGVQAETHARHWDVNHIRVVQDLSWDPSVLISQDQARLVKIKDVVMN